MKSNRPNPTARKKRRKATSPKGAGAPKKLSEVFLFAFARGFGKSLGITLGGALGSLLIVIFIWVLDSAFSRPVSQQASPPQQIETTAEDRSEIPPSTPSIKPSGP